MGNAEIKQVNDARYLGVILDDNLNFKKQYETVENKLENTVQALIYTRNLYFSCIMHSLSLILTTAR